MLYLWFCLYLVDNFGQRHIAYYFCIQSHLVSPFRINNLGRNACAHFLSFSLSLLFPYKIALLSSAATSLGSSCHINVYPSPHLRPSWPPSLAVTSLKLHAHRAMLDLCRVCVWSEGGLLGKVFCVAFFTI